MSVINQVLLNLERRRASPAERGLLPDHVQVLPELGRAHYWGWVAAGVALAVAGPAGWMALTKTIAEPAHSSAARPGAEGVIEQVVSASAGVSSAARAGERDNAHLLELRTFRLSLELSNPPAERLPGRGATPSEAWGSGNGPLSTARVVGRPAAESAAVPTPAAPVKPLADAASQPEIRKEVRDPTPGELAENEYRKAVALLNQGRLDESEADFRAALGLNPEHHRARQALIGLMIQGRKFEEAERLLEEGVRLSPAQTGFSMTLARLQADRGETAKAILTLQQGIENAQGNAEYAAFFAALLQRQGRHEEAIAQFQTALRLRPGAGVWWLGLGMSLQAAGQLAAAQNAYRQARAAGNLHPELAALAEQRLKQLQ